jgi:hypothetical protein
MLSVEQINRNWNVLYNELGVPLSMTTMLLAFMDNEHDTKDTGAFIAYGFKCAPGSTHYHHAYLGGLVEHLLEMTNMAPHVMDLVGANDLDILDVKQVILLHDLHKAAYHYTVDKDHNTCYYKNPTTALYPNNIKSLLMAQGELPGFKFSDVGRPINARVMHALVNSEGGYGDMQTRDVSVLAKIVYLLDELSVVHNRVAQRMFNSARKGQDEQWAKDLRKLAGL